MRVKETVDELKGCGSDAIGVAADVTKEEDTERLYREVVDRLGSIDILVNNVGGSQGRSIDEMSDEQLKNTFDLNIFGALRLIRLALPDMRSRQWGRVINIASIYGREHGGGLAYMTAKAALIGMTKHMALSLAKDGVLVNSVAPGSIDAPGGTWERFQKQQPPEVVKEFIDRNLPMGKFGWPEPVGDAVAFLASERASLITGACINIDGGQSKSLF